MIDLEIDENYILDLKEDFIMNTTDDLYKFIDKDPTRAFHLGVYIKDWFDLLDKNQQYLYTKQLRHYKEDIVKYLPQVKFWTSKYPEDEEQDLQEVSEYMLNNIFWEEENEESDKVKMAFFLGQGLRMQADKKDE